MADTDTDDVQMVPMECAREFAWIINRASELDVCTTTAADREEFDDRRDRLVATLEALDRA